MTSPLTPITPAQSVLTPLNAVPANSPLQDPQVAMAFSGLVGALNYWTGRATTLINSLVNAFYSGLSVTCGPVAGGVNTPQLDFAAFRGTYPAQTAMQNGDLIGAINASGADGTNAAGLAAGVAAAIQIKALENWTATKRGTEFDLITTTVGTATLNPVATFKNSGCNFVGTTTNDAAGAGNYGEIIQQQILGASAINIAANNIPGNLAAIALTPGDWDVDGNAFLFPNGNASPTYMLFGINTASGTLPDGSVCTQLTLTGAGNIGLPCATQRLSLAANTNVYLVTQFGWNNAAPQPTMCGIVRARRVR